MEKRKARDSSFPHISQEHNLKIASGQVLHSQLPRMSRECQNIAMAGFNTRQNGSTTVDPSWCSSHGWAAEGDVNTRMDLFQTAALEKKLLSKPLQHIRAAQVVCVNMSVSVIVLSLNPLQLTESWKLLRDIRKQWPHKTMQTRSLGTFPMSPLCNKLLTSSTHHCFYTPT